VIEQPIAIQVAFFFRDGAPVWRVLVWLIVIVAVVGLTVFMNMGPTKCPSCKHVNIFRRTKTGQQREVNDDDGVLRRTSKEYDCGRCGGRYWMIWDDFDGIWASTAANPDNETQPASVGTGTKYHPGFITCDLA
jgi:hypothetical protein